MLQPSREQACLERRDCVRVVRSGRELPWRLMWVCPAWTPGPGSCLADGAVVPPVYVRSLGGQHPAGTAAPRGSRQAGVLRLAVSGDHSTRGATATGPRVPSGAGRVPLLC